MCDVISAHTNHSFQNYSTHLKVCNPQVENNNKSKQNKWENKRNPSLSKIVNLIKFRPNQNYQIKLKTMENSVDDKDQSKSPPVISESSDSDHESLTIALENESTPKRKGRSKTKQVKQFDGRTLDRTIEETIEKCENITPDAAKKMLLKLIKNEHVLALSLLKAEEQENQERSKNAFESDDDDKKSEIEAPSTPKLTRLKAKQLNKTLPTPGSLTAPEPCQDVVALVQDELFSDDEDIEYQPVQSDEDVTNTTFSDIESQPSTPGSALLYSEQDFDSPAKVNEFKVPKLQCMSAVSKTKQFESVTVIKFLMLG